MWGQLPQEPVHVTTLEASQKNMKLIAALLERMASLEMKVCYFEEKLAQVESEKAALLDRQFSIEKMKDDDVAILFYTGFPNYEALLSFYTYIIQVWEELHSAAS